MIDDETISNPTGVREAHEYVRELHALHDLAVVAEELTRLLEAEGLELLDHDDRLELDQARSNAASVQQSLGRLL